MLSSGIRGEWEVERGGGMWEGDGTVWCMYDWVCVWRRSLASLLFTCTNWLSRRNTRNSLDITFLSESYRVVLLRIFAAV